MTRPDESQPRSPETATHRLIEQLGDGLVPVRRVPPLRVAAAAVLALAAAYATWLVSFGGLRPDFANSLAAEWPYAGVLVGLGLAAIGGLVASLASGTPGRESVVRAGVGVALLGWLGGIALCLFSLASNGLAFGPQLARDSTCFQSAAGYGVLPAAGLLAYALRGWITRPLVTSALALAGAATLGAMIVHLGCPMDGGGHFLWGHLTPPIVIATICTFPLGYGLRRLIR